jgi:hypothetical protein
VAKDIFLSYAQEDHGRIGPLVRALEAQHWTVFWDRKIPPGKTWRQTLDAELEACRAVVVVWSRSSVESHWVQEEADEGKDRGILFPVLIDAVKPPRGFRSIQWADLVGWDGSVSAAELVTLVEHLANLLEESSARASRPRPGTVFRDCDDGPEMVVDEPGRYPAEGPQHKVTIARSFAVAKYPVTFDEWDACVAAGGCAHRPGDEG